MTLQRIRAEDCTPQAWRNGGGHTRELLVWPPADPADPWQLRISRADIDVDGPFSAFPGVQRWFAVLQGAGVALQLEGERVLHAGGAPLQFDGAAAPACRLLDGPTQDLNLMVRGGKGLMQAVQPGQPWHASLVAGGLYTCHAGQWTDGTLRLHLAAHTLLWHPQPHGARWQFVADAGVQAPCAYWLGFLRKVPPAGRRMSALTLWRNARLATLQGSTPWGWIADGALLTQGDRIVWVGEASALPAAQARQVEDEYDLGGALLTPGLVDCHTHLVYGGQRAAEFEQRLQGASYEEIARAGGGIRSTVAATRAASDADLLASATRRAHSLMAEGVTTLEIKSGYGLSEQDEARCLRVARALGDTLPLTVRTTYLGAHAVPPEFAGRADDYVDAVCAWLPALQAQGLVDAVDAFCETMGFTPAQTRRVFNAARALGLPVKLHAEQLSDQGGAALAAEFGALSCDHLEHLSEAGIRAMQAAGSVAVLLPGAYYFLRDTKLPPIASLRAQGVPLAIATDHNPGTSPGLSLLLMLNMACTLFRLTPEEALRGATVHGARALGLHDRGTLAAGQRADFCVWDLEHPHELAYWFGHNPCRRTVVGGLERTA